MTKLKPGDTVRVVGERGTARDLRSVFGEGSSTVDHPVPTIANMIADEYDVRHEDVDVDVRADENDAESIRKRDEAMGQKILKVWGDATNALVIVGENHRASIAERLARQGFLVESLPL